MQQFIEERPLYIIKCLKKHYDYNIDLSEYSENGDIEVEVFPNPANNYFTVNVESEKVVSGYLNIYNTQKHKDYCYALTTVQLFTFPLHLFTVLSHLNIAYQGNRI
ncbi:MAG: hypothetical protein PF489_12025 [Salinivirgaceae bacterium]|jgi:hypothetical protein|nr:hypothetical protein [Salinivirgaceae bacterium]